MDAIRIGVGHRCTVISLRAVCRRSRAGLLSAILMLFSASLAPAAFVGTTALVMMPTTAFAQSGEPPCDPGDFGNPDGDGDESCTPPLVGKGMGGCGGSGCTQPQGYTGDPIDNSTGNIYVEEDDFRGGGVWPLHLTRSYNSSTSVLVYMSPSTHGIVGYTYPFGQGWNFTYGPRLLLDNESPLTSLEALRGDGKVLTFTLTNSTWSPDADVNDQLTEQIDSSGNPTSWTLTDADRNVEHYDATGHLLYITNRAGLTQTFTYSTSTTPSSVAPTPGLLLSVTDPEGRSLQFTYNAQSRVNTMTDSAGESYTYAYDSNGDLTSVTYPDSNVRKYTYVSNGLGSNQALASVVDETGTTYSTYTYNSYSVGTSVSLAGGVNAYQLALNSSTGAASAQTTDALGAVRNYGMQLLVNAFRNNQVQDPCGGCANPINTTTYTYNANGYVTSETHVLGDGSTPRNLNYTWDTTTNLLLTFVDGAGSPQQRTTNTTWNAALRAPLTRVMQDSTGKTVAQEAWAYNAAGQVTARCNIDPSSSNASYACGSISNAPTGVRQWSNSYCTTAGGNCPLVGLLLTETGPRTDVAQTTSYAYYTTTSTVNCGSPDAACYQPGDLESITDALGHVTTIASYDGAGRVTRTVDPNGVITDLSYTPRGWLATRSVRANADGSPSSSDAITTFSYTPYGAVSSITDPDGIKTSYTYDAAHRLVQITDALGNHVDFTLDAVGHRIAENTYASGSSAPSRSLSRQYDQLGRLVKQLDAYGNATSYTYDGNGDRANATDPLGVVTHSGYDALDRLVQTVQNYQGSDLATQNTTTSLSYDARDNLIRVNDPDSLNTQYTYDGLNDLDQSQSPDTGTSGYTYDAAGNRISQTDARGVGSTYSYDALNRLTAISYPTSTLDIHYHYDEPNSTTGCASSYPIGRLTRMTDVTGTTRYCYDSHGNVVSKTQIPATGSSGRITITYSYDSADRLIGVGYPGTDVKYTRDADGRVISVATPPHVVFGGGGGVTPFVSSISYLPFGPATQYSFPNGQALTKTYDANYHATDIVGGSALNLHFALDAMGDITAEGNVAGVPTPNETYQYDPLYRLQQVSSAGSTPWQSYTYDKTGDRLSKTTAQQTSSDTYNYTPSTHHLIGISGYDASNRAMDANGNTTAMQANGWMYGLGYDDTNRLTLVQQNGTTIATYGINGKGERVSKTVAGTQTAFAYDESGKLLYEQTGSAGRAYIWADGTPVAIMDNGTTVSYVYTDHLGTPRAVTATSGGIGTAGASIGGITSSSTVWTWPWAQNPFGEKPASGSGGYAFNLRYPGQYYDQETGLNYNYFRDYEAGTGRYIQSDPAGFAASINTYAYVSGNPLIERDRKGLQAAPPESIPLEQQSPYPLLFPPQGSSGSISVPGMPEDEFPHLEQPEPNIPRYTILCREYYCDPDYGKPYCTAQGGPKRTLILDPPYPLASTIDSMPGCYCSLTIPEDLVH